MAQEGQGDQEDQATPLEDQTAQEQYPLLVSFPSNPQETSNLWGYPHYCLMVTEPTQTPSSGSSGYT